MPTSWNVPAHRLRRHNLARFRDEVPADKGELKFFDTLEGNGRGLALTPGTDVDGLKPGGYGVEIFDAGSWSGSSRGHWWPV